MGNLDMNTILTIIIGIIAFLIILIAILVVVAISNKNKKKLRRAQDINENNAHTMPAKQSSTEPTPTNIYKNTGKSKKGEVVAPEAKADIKDVNVDFVQNFMEFDEITDNMIVQNKGDKYVMVIKCQGINYDLMSESEMIAVEEGFIQFLNTLRFPIQLYVQTSSLDLTDSLSEYRKRVESVGNEFEKLKMELRQQQEYDEDDFVTINKIKYELKRKQNIYEYGKDIISNIERISKNKNILQHSYYVVVPYFISELGPNSFKPKELRDMAFSELYTRCRGLVGSLAVCNINAKILNSFELAELLYLAYNRDEGEIYSFRSAIEAQYDRLYHTAPDIIDKKMAKLDQEIMEAAAAKANEEIIKASGRETGDVEFNNAMIEQLVYENSKKYIKDYSGLIKDDVLKQALSNTTKEHKEKKEQTKSKANKKIEDEEIVNDVSMENNKEMVEKPIVEVKKKKRTSTKKGGEE